MSGIEFARKKARTGFGPLGIADGRQPFMPRVSHNPCLLMLPFRFAHPMRMRPLSVGRVTTPFIQQRDHYGMILLICKEFALKSLSEMNGAGIGAGKGSPDRQLVSNSEHQESLIRTQRPTARFGWT